MEKIFILLFIMQMILSFFLFLYLRDQKKLNPKLFYLSAMAICISWWSGFNALELWFATKALKLLAADFIYLSIVSLPILIFLFGKQMADKKGLIRPSILFKKYFYLWILPAITLIFIFTDPLFGIVRKNIFMTEVRGILVLSKDYNHWFWIHTIYSYALIIYGIFLYLKTEIHNKISFCRIILVLLAILSPVTGNLLYIKFNHRFQFPADLTTFSFFMSISIFAFLLTKLDYINLFPKASNLFITENSDPVILLDKRDKLLYYNKKGADILGLRPGDLGTPISRFRVSSESKNDNNIIKFGSVSYQMHSRPIRRHGKDQGTIVTLYDITYLKEKTEFLEDELDSERSNLKTILHSLIDAVIAIDGNDKITLFNAAAEKLTELNRNEVLGKKINEILQLTTDPEGHSIVENQKSLLEIQNDSQIIYLRSHKDNLFPVSISKSDLKNREGIQSGSVYTIKEMTSELQLREMIIHNEKMRSIGSLAAGMAHEINNPLAGIILSSKLLSNRLNKEAKSSSTNLAIAEELDLSMEKIMQYMEKREIFRITESIIESSKKISLIVTSMINFSKTEDVKNKYDLRKIMNDALTSLTEENPVPNLTISCKYDELIPDLFCSKSKIELVFVNILKNGIYAMKQTNTTNPELSISIKSNDRYLNIEIKNNGPGINSETKNRMFEPFYTTNNVGEGFGLGLSIAYYIINNEYYGSLEVDSTSTSGTNFKIRLPIKN